MLCCASILGTFATGSAYAEPGEVPNILGPVGAYQPINTKIGSKRVIVFFVPEDGGCAASAVIWDDDDVPSSRVRMKIGGAGFHIGSFANQSTFVATKSHRA